MTILSGNNLTIFIEKYYLDLILDIKMKNYFFLYL